MLRTVLLGLALLGLGAGCGSGDSGGAASAPEAPTRRPPPEPVQLASPAPQAAAPGALSGGSMWARNMGGGGGGGRTLAREALERNRRERLAREGPQRPESERHAELIRDGQDIARALAAGMPAGRRAAFEAPPNPNQSPEEAVRERCAALADMNTEALRERGDSAGLTRQAFLGNCQRFPIQMFQCADRGDEARSDPDCRQHLARLDREVATLRRDGREAAHPEQRIDGLVQDQWETERDSVAPETLAPEAMN